MFDRMKSCFAASAAAILAAGISAAPAGATIISVSGPMSSAGVSAAKIAAPAHILDDVVTNSAMQGFDEAQNVLTTMAWGTDSGPIAAGTLVNSHMFFLNSAGSGMITHGGVVWTFDGAILGIMSDSGGTFEAASTAELGNPATNYTAIFGGSGAAAPFGARGLEGNNGTGLGASDGYTLLAPNVLRVSMRVTEPGDWIRVVTAVPEPGTLAVFGLGLAALGIARRRRAS